MATRTPYPRARLNPALTDGQGNLQTLGTPGPYQQPEFQPTATQPVPPDNSTAANRTAAAQPAMSFTDAVNQYQQQNPYQPGGYEGLMGYLDELGIEYERPTHAQGTLLSDDKLTDPSTGIMYDLVRDVGGANAGWSMGQVQEHGGGGMVPLGGSFTSQFQLTGTPYLDQLLGKSGPQSMAGGIAAAAPAGGPAPAPAPAPDIRANPGEDPFAAIGGGVYNYLTGSWVPKDHPEAAAALATQHLAGGSGGSVSGSVTSQTVAPRGGIQSVYDMIDHLLGQGGAGNQALMDTRMSAARDTLERARASEMDTLSAQLAERGLLGSGGEAESLGLLGERLGTIQNQTMADILNEEAGRADTRLLQTLATGAGLSTADANRIIAEFEAQTDRQVGMAGVDAQNRATASRERLGLGELDLRQQLGLAGLNLDEMGMMLNYSLGLGNLGLGYDRLGLDSQNSQADWLKFILGPAGPNAQSGQGYV